MPPSPNHAALAATCDLPPEHRRPVRPFTRSSAGPAPPRSPTARAQETEGEIKRLNEQIAQLQKEHSSVQSALDVRSKRFAGFMHAVHDMQLLLDDEAKAEGGGEGKGGSSGAPAAGSTS